MWERLNKIPFDVAVFVDFTCFVLYQICFADEINSGGCALFSAKPQKTACTRALRSLQALGIGT
jgi:hypothetical protein